MSESIEERIQEELYAYILAASSTGVIPDEDGTDLSDCIFQALLDSLPGLAHDLASKKNANQAKDYLEEALVEIAEQGAMDAVVPIDQVDVDGFVVNFADTIAEMMEAENLFAI